MLESPETLHRKEVWVRRARKHLPFYPAGLEDEDVPRQISSFVISINATKGLQLPLIVNHSRPTLLGCRQSLSAQI